MTAPTAAITLDTTAVMAYVEGTNGVGPMLARASERGEQAIVPALCLADAYRQVDSEGALLLDLLHDSPTIIVTAAEADDCAVLGGWTRTLGRMDLAHAALEAATFHIPLVTADRDLVTQILPKEWPIIDL
jgi:hypothetical protein